MKALRVAALSIALAGALGASAALAGCGSATARNAGTPAAQALQREDLLAAVRGLSQIEGPVQREMAAARTAWPLVANGFPPSIPPATSTALASAAGDAQAIVIPTVMDEVQARSLTGPAAGIASLLQSFTGLTARGWTLTAAASAAIKGGSPAAAHFARENVALYIESVYDGHFNAGLIGKSVLAGYHALGGQGAFGGALSEARVQALADAYSPASEQLHPHAGVRLGA